MTKNYKKILQMTQNYYNDSKLIQMNKSKQSNSKLDRKAPVGNIPKLTENICS